MQIVIGRKKNILLACIIVLCTIAFIFKIFICEDISISDEAHMFATSYRFLQGDAVLVDDWSPEQLYGVVLLPFVAVYRLFSGSNEGLFLFMRFVYLALKLAILIYGLNKIKHINLNSVCLSLGMFMWYFFASWNIESLTYQQLPLILGMLILIGFLADNTSKTEYMLMGLAYALGILSQPFLLFSYLIVIAWIVRTLIRERKINYSILFFHIGILIAFVPFVLLLLSRANVSEILNNISYIFSEQDHSIAGSGLLDLLNKKVVRVFNAFIYENTVTTTLNTSCFIVLHIAYITRWKYRSKLKPLVPVCLIVSILSMIPANKMFLMNEMYIPFIWASLESLFFIKNRRYLTSLILGYIFVIAIALGTNTGKYTTSGALSLVAVLFIFFWNEKSAVSETQMECPPRMIVSLRKMLFYIPVTLIVVMTLFLRVYMTWWGIPLSVDCYKNKISVGPMKGLFADDAEYNHYMTIWRDIQSTGITEEDILFCGTATPMAYLDSEASFGTMGTPFFNLDYIRLKEYWDLHPEGIPTVIYYEKYTSADSESFVNEMLTNEFDIRTEGTRLIAVRKQYD